MRFNNQLTVKSLANGDSSSKMSAKDENCDNSSEISDSMEDAEVIETNNNHSTMSDNFSWSISKPDLGLTKITKSFAVLCEPEGEAFEGRDCKQAPTSR